jgi:hypothetical protein
MNDGPLLCVSEGSSLAHGAIAVAGMFSGGLEISSVYFARLPN